MSARRWPRRLALAAALLPVAYLLLLHLWLDSGLAERQLARGDRFRIRWRSAWSVWPGHVEVRGLRLGGRAGGTQWSVAAERAAGVLDLRALGRREARFSGVRAQGVATRIVRATTPEPQSPRQRSSGGGTGGRWLLRFDDVRVEDLHSIQLRDWLFRGTGEATGTFAVVPGRRFALERSRLTLRDATVDAGATPLARHLALDAAATLGPYDPRQHRGLAALDLLSGTLVAHGEAPALARLGRAVSTTPALRGEPALALDVRLGTGHLLPGTRLELRPPGAEPNRPRLRGAVERSGAVTALVLDVTGSDLTLGGATAASPRFHADTLELRARTAETRLLALVSAGRALRAGGTATGPLLAELRAGGVRVEAPGHRATLRATGDRLAARVDVAALLRHDVIVPFVEAAGVAVELLPGSVGTQRSPLPTATWSLDLGDARLHELRELTVADYRLAGNGAVTASLRYDRNGVLSVSRQTLELRDGRFDFQGETAARELSVHASGALRPVTLGPGTRVAVERAAAATADFHADIRSLAFLAPYIGKTGWLTVAGAGALDGHVTVDGGRLLAGSLVRVRAEPVQAQILDSVATGRATVEATVAGPAPGTATTVQVRFDRFELRDAQRARQPAYLRGRGLMLAATAPGALDLAGGIPEVTAQVDLADGELPDLAVYDALLPAGSGVSVLGGRGRVRLHLEASSATRAASGSVELRSADARLRFQDLDLAGTVSVRAPLRTRDLLGRRFDLTGVELALSDMAYGDAASTERAGTGWWANARLADGTVHWAAPMELAAHVEVTLRNSGPLLVVFGQKTRLRRAVVHWFDDTLRVENVLASGAVRVSPGRLDIEGLRATSGPLELRTRMSFAAASKRGDLYLRYGHLAAGVALRDGQRTLRLHEPLEWYESGGDHR